MGMGLGPRVIAIAAHLTRITSEIKQYTHIVEVRDLNPISSAALALAAGVLLSACTGGEKDPQANYDLMKDITYNSVTEGTGIYKGDETNEYRITGTGVVVGDRYLTVDHVVSRYEKVTYFSMSASRVPYSSRQEQTYLLNGEQRIPLKEIVNDRRLDIAVFRIPPEYCDGVCNDMDASDLYMDELALGTDVMFIGYPAKIGHYYREAKFAGMIDKGKQYNDHELPVDAIAIFPSLITGDSGSGLFDKRTGKLMGINYYNIQTLGLVKPIGVFEPYLGMHQTVAYGRARMPLM